jgi:hypothetical protein
MKESRGGNQVPAYFGAYVTTRFRKAELVESKKDTGQQGHV